MLVKNPKMCKSKSYRFRGMTHGNVRVGNEALMGACVCSSYCRPILSHAPTHAKAGRIQHDYGCSIVNIAWRWWSCRDGGCALFVTRRDWGL